MGNKLGKSGWKWSWPNFRYSPGKEKLREDQCGRQRIIQDFSALHKGHILKHKNNVVITCRIRTHFLTLKVAQLLNKFPALHGFQSLITNYEISRLDLNKQIWELCTEGAVMQLDCREMNHHINS
jgi:hypothetical protein